MRRTRSAWLAHEASLQLVDRLEGAAQGLHVVELGRRRLDQLVRLGLDDLGALEDVVVLEQVRLVGEHLLDAQRPLLVPRPRQAQRLVPRRELHGPGPGVLRQRHPQRLEDDPLHVVLRLLLGEAERVDLDAVAEAPQLGVLDAVALAADAVPHARERPHLARLLDEADARVHEEADAADHGREVGVVDLARGAHAVEHADGRGERERDLLHGGGPRLLEVVAAHVDRVPPGRVRDRVGDGVDREAQARAGREDVRPPAQVLLHDVVLRGAGEPGGVHAHVLRVGDVETEQPRRGGVDRHGRVHVLHGYPVEELLHVPEVGDRHADLADLALRLQRVGVVAGLRRQVEGDGQARLPLGQVRPVELVGGAGGRVARVGADHPGRVTLAASSAHLQTVRCAAAGARHSFPHADPTGCSRRSPSWPCARAVPT